MLVGLLLFQAAAVASAWDTFLVPHTPGENDTPGLLSLVTNHSSNATILFSKGVTYNIFTAIKFPVLANIEIRIEGNLTYPTNVSQVQGTQKGCITICSELISLQRLLVVRYASALEAKLSLT
jgi:hypothetical protein